MDLLAQLQPIESEEDSVAVVTVAEKGKHLLVVVAWWLGIIAPLVLAWFGEFDKVYYFIEHNQPPLSPHEIFLFNKITGFALSACVALFVASYQLSKNKTWLEKYARTSEKRLLNRVEGAFAGTFPLMEMLLNDSPSYNECKETVNVVAGLLHEKNISQRVIMRSVIAGHRERIKKTASGLTSTGVFMDVEERRLLTEELYRQEKSYVIVVKGFHHILTGSYAWHQEYLSFIKEKRKQVAWVYVGDLNQDMVLAREAVSAVKNQLGIPCYVSQDLDTGTVTKDCIESWKKAGPLIEVFGSAVTASLKDRVALPHGSEIAWKATQLCYRAGARVAPEYAEILDIDKAAEKASGISVWNSEEVSKRVTANAGRVGVDEISKGLLHVLATASQPKFV